MDALADFLRRQKLWPVWVLVAGVLLLLPWLGKPGFWEPHEIQVADQARSRLERYSLQEITKAVSRHYRVRESDMKSPGRGEKQTEARNVAIYLADEHTRETYSDLRQAFALDKHEVVESIVKGMRERVGNSAERDLHENLAAIEKELAERDKGPKPTGPPLTEWAIARGLDDVSWDEWGARLPLALLGLIALMATYFLGQRLGGPRAGLIASLVMMSFPLFVLQSRQLTSDIGAVTGSTLMMLGLVGLSWPAGDRRETPTWMKAARYAGDPLLVVAGAACAYYAGGALLGVLPPLAAVALANPIAAVADRRDDEVPERDRTWRLVHLLATGIAVGVVAIVVLGWLVTETFDFTDPIPGKRQIFGHSWEPHTDYVAALGGVWKTNGDLGETFNSMFEQVAFGLFPWSALAPIAIGYLALGMRRGRHAWAGYVLFLWAAAAWAFATIMTRKVGPVHYPAIAAVAVAIGVWLDRLLTARSGHDKGGIRPTLPLVGFFVAAATITLAKDIKAFPESLTSIHVLGKTVSYPKELWLTKGVLAIAVLFAVVGFVALWQWLPERKRGPIATARYYSGRFGLHALIGVGLVFALFLAQIWTPTLSRKLSSKHLFSVYHELKRTGDRLGVMGNHGNGPKYYAGDSYTRIRNRPELLGFLKDERRGFALVPAGELCPVHREAAKSDMDYFVLDNSHASFLLMSNQLEEGEDDKNPLREAIVRSRPPNVGRKVSANFDNKIELIGIDMPNRVDRGDKFPMTLYFKVLKPVRGTWKIFAHFDTAGMRFQGDHDPIEGRCSTAYWQPGDYIVDRYWVEAGDISYPKTTYQLRVGFFQGSHGNWKNMPVVEGNADPQHRVYVGNIQVQ